MTTDFRAMCAELVATLAERIDDKGDAGPYFAHAALLLNRARVALAEPEPEEPTDEELSDLWSRAAGQDQGPWPTQQHCFARAVLARWSRHTPVPVPVSERWPGPEDCTAEGRYWIWTKAGAIWRWQLVYLQFIDLRHGEQTHWLPAHALPLPQGEVEP
jgi:hypothetical protein